MAEARLTRRVMHAPDDLMGLVADVEKYPEFINLISAIRVTQRQQITETHQRFEAEATIAYKFFRERFSSVVDVIADQSRISVKKADRSGAVRTLKNEWVFHELSDGSTLIDFYVEVRLKAFPLEMVMRDKFDKAGQHIMNLFEKKASQSFVKVGDINLDLRSEYQTTGQILGA